MDELNKSQWSENQPVGSRVGEQGGGVPPPPPPPVTIRTMGSDIESLQKSGGGQPTGEVINQSQSPVQKPAPEPGLNISAVPGYTGPEEKLFAPETLPTPQESPAPVLSAPQSGRSKQLIIISLAILAVLGLGAAGYFYVYPLLFPSEVVVTTTTPEPAPTPPPASIVHKSFITSDKAEVALSISAAKAETATGAQLIKEVVLNDTNGKQITFPKYFPTIIPEFKTDELANVFEEDFTAFIYYDQNGVWPGYVAKLKSGSSLVIAQPLFNKIENYAGAENIFIQSPGTRSAEGFKSGQANGVPTRYLTFSSPGSALNYGWFNNQYLVITTSYPAMLEATKRLVTE